MGTWGEVAALATDAVRLWRRFLGQLVFWFSIGYAVSLAAREASARFGSGQIVLANVCFGISLIATACATLLMIHCLGPGLPALQRLLRPVRDGQSAARAPRVDGAPPDLPPDVLEHRDRLDTLAAVVGPVLAVYSVWGLVEDQVRQLFFVNAVVNGLFEPEKWSINFDRIGFYLGGAALVWVVRTALGRVTRHLADEHTPRAGRLARWLTPGFILLEGLWVFLAFAAGRRLVERAQTWWSTRTVQAWLFDLWEGATGLLPTVVVPVPELVRGVGSWLFTTLLPVTFHEVGLPLVLLAVTCMVFGWRQADLGELAGAAGLRRVRARMGGSSRRLLPRATTLLTEDVRTRFVPLVHSLRMLLRGGPRLVGAFLVLASALSLLQGAVPWVLLRAVGPTGSYPGVALGYALDLAVGGSLRPLPGPVHRRRGASRPSPREPHARERHGRSRIACAGRSRSTLGARVGAAPSGTANSSRIRRCWPGTRRRCSSVDGVQPLAPARWSADTSAWCSPARHSRRVAVSSRVIPQV